jgi:hypothetical protein
MNIKAKSIRPFIGSKNYTISKGFYIELGFIEVVISEKMSYFSTQEFGFYLQDYYLKDWIDNSMVFLEVNNLENQLKNVKKLELPKKYKNVKLSEIKHNDWGNEFFLHDPSGILWHFGEFN